MPVIVIGADTPLGREVLGALQRRDGEVRAFVTSEAEGARLRDTPIRVAVGDLSDGSHVAGAALECFSAVLVTGAASDGRELAFATDAAAVHGAWADAIGEAGVTRAIWVGIPPPKETTPEAYEVDIAGRDPAEIAAEVAALDDRPVPS